MWRAIAVGGRAQLVRIRRIHQIGRDENDQLGFLVFEVARTEQRTEHRQVPYAGNTVEILTGLLLDQPGQDEAATGGQFHGRLGAVDVQGGNGEPRNGADDFAGIVHDHTVLRGDRPLGGEFGHFGRDAQADAPLRQHHRREAEPNAERLVLDLHIAVAVAADRDREFTTGKEIRGFARDRRQIRFGKGAHQSDALHRLQQRGDIGHARGIAACPVEQGAGTTQEAADAGKGRLGLDCEIELARIAGRRQVDAELAHDGAAHLDDAHLQHHLLAGLDRYHGENVFRIVDPALGDPQRRVGVGRARHRAGQDDMVIHRLGLDPGVRQEAVQRALQRREIAFDPQVEIQDQLTVGVEEKRIGLADAHAHQIRPARCAHDGVDDSRIGDQDVSHIDRQMHDGGLGQRQVEGFGDRAVARLADIDLHRIAAFGAGRLGVPRCCGEGGDGEKDQGADHRGSPHSSPASATCWAWP